MVNAKQQPNNQCDWIGHFVSPCGEVTGTSQCNSPTF